MSASQETTQSILDVTHGARRAEGDGVGRGDLRPRAHGAFWIMVRRVVVLAACVDFAFLVFFLAIQETRQAWPNLISIALYAGAYVLLTKRKNVLALSLIWAEVIGHAALGTLFLGWNSGFHYYLLMFIPAIVVSGGWRVTIFPLLFLFAFYTGLHAVSDAMGALAPIGRAELWTLNAFNVAIFFAMASYTARFYSENVRKSERKLRRSATTDALTGLANRGHCLDLAKQCIAQVRRRGESLSLILADIDHFKQINDRFGHEAGDQVLRQAGDMFGGLCGDRDIVARWGGEEFLFLLPGRDAHAARQQAERIRAACEAAGVEWLEAGIRFTLSAGVSTLAPAEDINAAIGRADKALYRSKYAGRNLVSVAD
ncbi:MAG: GGDEF domain-containing protein [Betaproteobacteria bacterium]|nr:GGDEF domain-containing protein [Betaproteobacteria bacterium]